MISNSFKSIDRFFRPSGINNDQHVDEKEYKTSDTRDEYLIGSSVFKAYGHGFMDFLVTNAARSSNPKQRQILQPHLVIQKA